MAYGDSASDRLTAVRAAIAAILTGAQSYGIGGRNVSRANLAQLYEMERDLMFQVEREGTPMVSVGMIERPS